MTVLVVGDFPRGYLKELLASFDLSLVLLPLDARIVGSFWGDREAGIAGSTLFARPDTPLHSLLHEACHVICMDCERRATVYRDAGGDDLEESAVCYLQILLADQIEGVGRDRMMLDMDEWGYSFRLGSTRRWFENDAGDATARLEELGLLGESAVQSHQRIRKKGN